MASNRCPFVKVLDLSPVQSFFSLFTYPTDRVVSALILPRRFPSITILINTLPSRPHFRLSNASNILRRRWPLWKPRWKLPFWPLRLPTAKSSNLTWRSLCLVWWGCIWPAVWWESSTSSSEFACGSKKMNMAKIQVCYMSVNIVTPRYRSKQYPPVIHIKI